jgi:hypothetical protein
LRFTIIMQKFAACDACASTISPRGAKFCSNCGKRLSETGTAEGEEQVPMAAAVPVEDASTITPATVIFDEGTATSENTAAPPANNNAANNNRGAAAFSSSAEATAAAAASTNDSQDLLNRAIYWKHPSPELLESTSSNWAHVMGGILFIQTPHHTTKGKFTLPKTIHVGNILSGSKLDLSCADFVHPVTTIVTGSILAGVKIIVPRGVRVETQGLGILGGFKGLRSQTVTAGQYDDSPLVLIQGFAILGGVKVVLNDGVAPLRVVE